MFNFRLLDLVFLFGYVFLLSSCASISSPQGGPRDETPPKIIQEKSLPQNNAVNYKGKIIELTFDEDVAAPKIAEQLLITPLEENPYKMTIKKNKIRLEFEKDFQPNTTYTFNFRESIKDITEGNSSQDLILAFSTGPYLDSISVAGRASDLLTNLPLENVLISLYKKNDTLSPLNSKPIYFTKSSGGGNYSIKNIKQNSYSIYAIDDRNKNLLLDDRERLAFIENINLDSSQRKIDLALSPFDNKPPKINSRKSEDNVVHLSLSKGVEKASVSLNIPGDTSRHFVYNIKRDGKIIDIYKTYEHYDSIPLRIALTDSSGNTSEELIKIIFQKYFKKDLRKEAVLFVPLEKKLNPGEANINLLFNNPIIKTDLEKIFIKTDTTVSKIVKENIFWKDNTSLRINKKNTAKDSVVLIIEKGAFTSLDTINKNDKLFFDIKREEEYGMISGQVRTKEENIIIELLDKNYRPVSTISNKRSFSFSYLSPGTYYIRVISDRNKNGRWDPLNLKGHKQAEAVHFYKDKIELRANWEIQDIIIQF